VKRHPALVPLSDDHHHELVQARRLVHGAEASPTERLAVARAYVAAFFPGTLEHFRREEESVFPLYAAHAGDARALRAEVAAEDVSPATLHALGELLHDHVRLEERELFQAVQRVVPAAELDELAARGRGGTEPASP
jgi:hemerythrin-like domain-containing protein